nr:hypothetical protein GCM10020093_077840 [Planobispora longispora]
MEVRRHRVRTIAAYRDHVVVDDRLAARTLVAADGANSTVRRLAGFPAAPERHTAIAVRGYADVPADDDVQFIAMQQEGWPAYAWSFPIGDGTANVGFGMLLPRLRATGLPGRQVLHGRLAELLPHLPARRLKAHHLPLSPGRPSPARAGCCSPETPPGSSTRSPARASTTPCCPAAWPVRRPYGRPTPRSAPTAAR